MRTLSPIRSTSPISRPKITFNYPPSPLRERPSNLHGTSPLTSKNQEKLSIQNSTSKAMKVSSQFQHCTKCAKMATYRSTNTGIKLCSSCAINEMRNGVQVIRIELKEQAFYKDYQHKFDKENHQNTTNKLSSRSHSFELKENTKSSYQNLKSQLIQLSKETQQLKSQMNGMLKQLQKKDFSSEGIKNIYREKKIGLKKHYQKIKEAIKASIQKDLQELEKQQQRSLQCLQDVKIDLKKGINLLDGLSQENENNHLKNEYPFDQYMNNTKSCLDNAIQKRNKAALIVNQLSAQEQGSDSQSDSLNLGKTQQQLQEAKKQLYDPQYYSLLDGKNKDGETLFSFEHKFK